MFFWRSDVSPVFGFSGGAGGELGKGKFDKYSQYVVVRQMNKLMKTYSRSEAEAFAKRFIGNLPDDAILFKFFEMRLKDGNLPDALKYANMILNAIFQKTHRA